jgi:hypothetical protein
MNQSSQVSFSKRRRRNTILTIAFVLVLACLVAWQNSALLHSSFATGYLLMACVVFLAAFNLRKKLPFLPALGSAATWMQIHIYVGFSTFAIFAFHIAWRIPDGMFEITLAALYMTVALSGVYGLYVTRVMPKRISALSEEIIFERIGGFRRELARQAKRVVVEACEQSPVLANFYTNRLAVYFERSRGLAYLVYPSGRQRRQLVAEIEDLDRYLAEDQRLASRKLAAIVRKKDDLDYHHAIQGRLKVWLFVHIGLTYSLLVAASLHGFLAHAFAGGLR